MSDFFKDLEKIQNFGRAIQNGLEKSIQMLPILTRQHMETVAKRKLHSTLEPFMEGVSMYAENYVFVVELEKDNWLANAVEMGISGFDMKKGLLSSPKARIGKQGQRYLRVPMTKDPNRSAETMGTEKSQEYQKLIQHVMRKPKFSSSQIKSQHDGSVIEMQKLITDEPKLQGYYRGRKFSSASDFFSGNKKGKNFQHVMFRVVSEFPSKTGATWEHPGIKPANIFKDVERDLPQLFETLLDGSIQSELQSLFGGM